VGRHVAEWVQRIEGIFVPKLRLIDQGTRSADVREAARALAAIHYARSYAVRTMQGRIGDMAILHSVAMSNEPAITALFTKQFGHPPAPSEMEQLVRDSWSRLTADGFFVQDRTIHVYRRSLDILRDRQCHILTAHPKITFVTGDTPVVLADQSLVRVGVQAGVALGDAATVWMPLSRGHSVAFAGPVDAPTDDRVVSLFGVQMFNGLLWRSAQRHLISHPSQDPSRLLATQLDAVAVRPA
jgi:hypothetical protein